MTIKITHPSGLVSAEIIADSYNPDFDSRITTMIIEYPRIILAELNTHRALSKSSSSSRAIPVKKMLEHISNSPAMPMRFGENQRGMQDKGSDSNNSEAAKALWVEAAKSAASFATVMDSMGIHKQVCNRMVEPYQTMRTCITGTCWNNFFNLRLHPDADPTFYALAQVMKEAMDTSEPEILSPWQWHMPFVDCHFDNEGEQYFTDEEGNVISDEEALKISASCSAQTSFRLSDTSLEKAESIFKKLIESKPAHASPLEHQARAIPRKFIDSRYYFALDGVTHVDHNKVPWSGNFYGWVQHRQIIPENAVPY